MTRPTYDSFLIVTQEHQILRDGCQTVFRWVQKMKSNSLRRVRRGQTQIYQICSKTRGYVHFIPALEFFCLFRHTNRTSLIKIRTKVEGLKRLRSREIRD